LSDVVHVLLARLILIVHLGFILFVVAGGYLLKHWDYSFLLHIPCVIWAAGLSFFGWGCPLTDWEQWFLTQANYPAYSGSFIEHYLISLIYPRGLTRPLQIGLGLFVIIINVYWYVRLLPDSFRRNS
jgi:hypothetical protein